MAKFNVGFEYIAVIFSESHLLISSVMSDLKLEPMTQKRYAYDLKKPGVTCMDAEQYFQ